MNEWVGRYRVYFVGWFVTRVVGGNVIMIHVANHQGFFFHLMLSRMWKTAVGRVFFLECNSTAARIEPTILGLSALQRKFLGTSAVWILAYLPLAWVLAHWILLINIFTQFPQPDSRAKISLNRGVTTNNRI